MKPTQLVASRGIWNRSTARAIRPRSTRCSSLVCAQTSTPLLPSGPYTVTGGAAKNGVWCPVHHACTRLAVRRRRPVDYFDRFLRPADGKITTTTTKIHNRCILTRRRLWRTWRTSSLVDRARDQTATAKRRNASHVDPRQHLSSDVRGTRPRRGVTHETIGRRTRFHAVFGFSDRPDRLKSNYSASRVNTTSRCYTYHDSRHDNNATSSSWHHTSVSSDVCGRNSAL